MLASDCDDFVWADRPGYSRRCSRLASKFSATFAAAFGERVQNERNSRHLFQISGFAAGSRQARPRPFTFCRANRVPVVDGGGGVLVR